MNAHKQHEGIPIPILEVSLRYEQDISFARQRVMQLGGLAGLTIYEQTGLAAAVSGSFPRSAAEENFLGLRSLPKIFRSFPSLTLKASKKPSTNLSHSKEQAKKPSLR